MRRLGRLAICTAGLMGLAVASAATASGTLAPAGGAPDPYAQGKAIYARKLSCKDCPFPGGLRDAEAASAALQRIQQGEFGLSASERTAVTAYLSRRFKRG